MDGFVQLPFFGCPSFQFRKKLQKSFTDKVKFAFMLPVRVESLYSFKDKLPKMLLQELFYNYKCGGCNPANYGETKHYFKVQICKHLGI